MVNDDYMKSYLRTMKETQKLKNELEKLELIDLECMKKFKGRLLSEASFLFYACYPCYFLGLRWNFQFQDVLDARGHLFLEVGDVDERLPWLFTKAFDDV